MELEALVPAGEVGNLSIGQLLEFTVEGINAVQRGKIVRMSPSTSTGSRSVPIYLAIEQADPKLRVGLFAQANLPVQARANIIAIPLAAVRDSGGRNFVYVVQEAKLLEKEIKLGIRDDNARASNGTVGVVEVTQGLAAGDSIVAANLGALRVGSIVKMAGK
jgi:membrane fusion protein, multidrug efflux system